LFSQSRASSVFPRRWLASASHSQFTTAVPAESWPAGCVQTTAPLLEATGTVRHRALLGQRPELIRVSVEFRFGEAARKRRVCDSIRSKRAGAGHMVGPRRRFCPRLYHMETGVVVGWSVVGEQRHGGVLEPEGPSSVGPASRLPRNHRRPWPIPGGRRARGPAPEDQRQPVPPRPPRGVAIARALPQAASPILPGHVHWPGRGHLPTGRGPARSLAAVLELDRNLQVSSQPAQG